MLLNTAGDNGQTILAHRVCDVVSRACLERMGGVGGKGRPRSRLHFPRPAAQFCSMPARLRRSRDGVMVCCSRTGKADW